MAVPLTGCPEATYATKGNIGFPGSQTAATALEATAQTKINDRLPSLVTIAVAGGAIKVVP